MLFEFDENKSKINKQKHGIDFVEAQQLFNKKTKIIPAKEIEDEIRYAAIGYIDNKCYVMIFTTRNVEIRIISVRRCRKKEKELYES